MRVLYLSYNGLLDPLGQSQVLQYLIGLAGLGHKIVLLTYEKPDEWANEPHREAALRAPPDRDRPRARLRHGGHRPAPEGAVPRALHLRSGEFLARRAGRDGPLAGGLARPSRREMARTAVPRERRRRGVAHRVRRRHDARLSVPPRQGDAVRGHHDLHRPEPVPPTVLAARPPLLPPPPPPPPPPPAPPSLLGGVFFPFWAPGRLGGGAGPLTLTRRAHAFISERARACGVPPEA